MQVTMIQVRSIAAAALLMASACAHAGTAVDYAEALRQLKLHSGAINGAGLDFQAKTLQAEAMRRIDGPDLRLSGFAGRVSTTLSVDTSNLAQAAASPAPGWPPAPGCWCQR